MSKLWQLDRYVKQCENNVAVGCAAVIRGVATPLGGAVPDLNVRNTQTHTHGPWETTARVVCGQSPNYRFRRQSNTRGFAHIFNYPINTLILDVNHKFKFIHH